MPNKMATMQGCCDCGRCIADFSSTADGCIYTFTDESTPSDGATSFVSWDWDFGDGGTSTAQNPVHAFTAGTHGVSLTATDNLGRICTAIKTVECSPDPSDCSCDDGPVPESVAAYLPPAAPIDECASGFTACAEAEGYYGLDETTPLCCWQYLGATKLNSEWGMSSLCGCTGSEIASSFRLGIRLCKITRSVMGVDHTILQLTAQWAREFSDSTTCTEGRGVWEKDLGAFPSAINCKGVHQLSLVDNGDGLCTWSDDAFVYI